MGVVFVVINVFVGVVGSVENVFSKEVFDLFLDFVRNIFFFNLVLVVFCLYFIIYEERNIIGIRVKVFVG